MMTKNTNWIEKLLVW